MIERTRDKVASLEEDIKDLSAEFEVDRADYLSTIREQEKKIKLCEQLLATVVPCLRRDCNYFNLDKIVLDCVWKEDADQWQLPKLTINKTELVQTAFPKGVLDKRGTDTKKQSTSSTELGSLWKAAGQGHQHSSERLEEDRYRAHLQRKSDETIDYFKPKRAMELIGQSVSLSGKDTSSHYSHDVSLSGSDSISSLPNAAAVHGITNDSGYSRRPGKLESLTTNPPVPPAPSEPVNILEQMEKKMASRKGLQPLADTKFKKL